MNDFDSHFKKMQRNSTTIMKVSVIGFILTAVVSLGLLVAVVYVAAHFLAKVW